MKVQNLEFFMTAVCGIGLATHDTYTTYRYVVFAITRKYWWHTRWLMGALPCRGRVGLVRGGLEKKLKAFLLVAISIRYVVLTSSILRYSIWHDSNGTITFNFIA